MGRFWMIRAGEGGYLVEDFERTGYAGIGWRDAGDFTPIRSLEQMRERLAQAYPNEKPGWLANATGMTFKFRKTIRPGDRVVTYDPKRREYLIGTVEGEYEFKPDLLPDYNHVRKVKWEGRVSRDLLSPSSRNTLGGTLTIFEPGDAVLKEIEQLQRQRVEVSDTEEVKEEETQEEWQVIRRDVLSRAHEFIKDRVLALSPDEMESLVAAVLRAMGYKARVTPKGADRGRDVIASPDGLGFQQPRIIAEVKHRPHETMGAPQIRSFLGGLRSGDRGLYVSTGGYTREAKYEADRASVPVTLVDLDELASLVVEHYDRFDSDGRSLVPLIRVYWPA
jgi:restriction system protein